MQRLPRLTYAGVFLVAASVILLQIALTRVFAIMLWHHLTYMVVSIALLGFGASGSILTIRRRKSDAPPFGSLAGFTVAYGVSVILAFAAMRLVEIDSLKLWEDKSNLVALLVLYSITAVPFLLAGMVLGTALTCFVQHVNKLYFVDLLGSGAGGAASVVILSMLGGPATIMVAAAIALLAGFLFGFAASKTHRMFSSAGLALGILVALMFSGAGQGFGLPHVEWHPPFAAGKSFAGLDPKQFDRLFSSTAEVEVAPEAPSLPMLGGDVGKDAQRMIPARKVGQDGTAPTFLFRGAGDIERMSFVKHVQPASALISHAAAGGKNPDVLVIGVGGGMDVMVALASGAGSVTAAEINTAMVKMVTERYDEYLGGLFRPGAHEYSDRLKIIVAEGRSFVRTQPKNYDIIQMSGVDSFTALSTGAYTLSETYLYTTEAIKDFYAHLKDGGYINYSRFLLSHPGKPRETLRLTNIACTALEELGIENPQSHIVVLQGAAWASTMVKKGPFTRVEIDALKKFARDQMFLGLIYDPLRKADEEPKAEIEHLDWTTSLPHVLDQLIRIHMPPAALQKLETVRERLTSGYAEVLRLDQKAVEATAKAIATDFPESQRAGIEAGAMKVFTELFLSSIPAKANFAETAKIFHQLLAGNAEERLAFVEDYFYDISSCTDDRPFFFNYYRYSQMFEALLDPQASSAAIASYTSDMPVGHIVLFVSLVQITLLAAILIFLPLWRLRSTGVKTVGVWRYFAFFGALGMGFMFVEIVLMQKMVIFLGHPIYAVSVVLSALLCFAGVGSLLASRIESLSRANLKRLVFAIIGLVIAVCILMNYVMPALLGWSLGIRIVAVTAMIAPIGIALGMPFPTGMRIVQANCPELLPWCWAINGFLSVFSSIFCIVGSMIVGFTVMMLAAALVYAIGFYALMPIVSPTPTSPSLTPETRPDPAL